MANEIVSAGNSAFRDYVTDGVASSGANEPDKSEVRSVFQQIQTDLDTVRNQAGVTASMLVYATKAELDANLVPEDGRGAWVTDDPTPANNGIYSKDGATGAGDWDKVAELPGNVAALTVSGTANAIIGATTAPVNSGAMQQIYLLEVGSNNTGSVTININSTGYLPLNDSDGSALSADDLVSGTIVPIFNYDGTEYRLLITATAIASATAAAASASVAVSSASAASSSASTAETARDTAIAASEVNGPLEIEDTYSDANTAKTGWSEGQEVMVLVDETRSDSRTIYRLESGSLVFKLNLNDVLNANQIKQEVYEGTLWIKPQDQGANDDPSWKAIVNEQEWAGQGAGGETYYNYIMQMGWGMDGGTETREDASRVSFNEVWEYKYYQSSTYASERHSVFTDINGDVHRYYSAFLPWDGGFNNLITGFDLQTWRSWDQTRTFIRWDMDNENVYLGVGLNAGGSPERLAFNWDKNNEWIIAQSNAAKSAYVPLAYLDSSDVWQFGNGQQQNHNLGAVGASGNAVTWSPASVGDGARLLYMALPSTVGTSYPFFVQGSASTAMFTYLDQTHASGVNKFQLNSGGGASFFRTTIGTSYRWSFGTNTSNNFFLGMGDPGTNTCITIDSSSFDITLHKNVIMNNLPTSDPTNAGELWNDSGTVKISAG